MSQRVLYVLWRYPVPSERFVERELEALARQGVEVEVLVAGPPPRARERIDGVHYRPGWLAPRVWTALFATALRPARALRLAGRAFAIGRREGPRGLDRALRLALLAPAVARSLAADPPRLLHAHFATGPTTFAALLSVLIQRPFGFSAHAKDLYADRTALGAKLARASYGLACSQAAAADLVERVPEDVRGRVRALYHGLDLVRWRRRTPRPVAAGLRILAVGRLRPKKGFDLLVAACAHLRASAREFTCEIVGEGPEHARLLASIRRAGLDDRVTIHEWVEPQALHAFYERATVLVVPSRVTPDGDRDNVPNVVLEALALELPVVASSLPGISEVLGTDAGAVVPGEDPIALADAIERVADDRELARGMALSGRKVAEQRFDLERVGAQLARVFEDAAPTGAAAPAEGARAPQATSSR